MKRFLPFIILLAGCNLYFDGDDDADDECKAVPVADDITDASARDPLTGECQDFGGGGGCDSCGNCWGTAAQPVPDWASCFSACEGLDESSCAFTAGCHAAYEANSAVDEPPKFAACWAVAPSGPVHGSCAGLDGYECSRHDDCGMYYDNLGTPSSKFSSCRPELQPGDLCDTVDCEMGYHCEEQCYPCDSPDGNGCPPVCQAYCVSDGGSCEALGTEMECTARPDCSAIYQGEDCTCHENGSCTCETLIYDRCETR